MPFFNTISLTRKMWPKVLQSVFILLSIVCHLSAPLQLRAGQCPRIKPKASFDINKGHKDRYLFKVYYVRAHPSH
ncbi:unnamed protein product [Medioppia subpectinata]|uniref:Uncharacterized protein n=1 Tax=Medioppia subpectinata TaxID=1979941 RepID=A0A7R9KUH2_9ACAR|nr:unnamed protein product [Medioppia subpectinata]CAG2108717.1 unnamed protein product [Medioppia subpectinata]